MLRILIVEDEHLAARRLERLIREIDSQVEICETLDTVQGTVAWLQEHEVDLIFLDIHLADGNSFSIFEKIDVSTPIIFVTAYDQYAVRAFKVNSVDYLLKPIEQEDLAQAIDKFKQNHTAPAPFDISALMQAMQSQQTAAAPVFQKRFMVTSGDKIKSIPIEEVAYFFGQQKYVFLVTKDNRRHIVDFTLGKLEELLDPEQFYRINRQFIIGYKSISNMFAYSKSRVKIELDPVSEIDAIVSIEKSKHFKNWLNR
ncbi:LytTR family DNA-binding domain-containing protein [Pontibacter sp. G13]|uniref:LytR/AlgR family response regulator transcription factor n=1 Tax=Pontibacter sp. G13 TaxID=3074898 RepID=UPI00288B1B9D|nr:LytTR family DNA-binding domain-containing protein [Pontibacter sp. G13]WNJ17244.1 LytTR family DNA-binding domain-containing protein [Pontibacter sp. G13]